MIKNKTNGAVLVMRAHRLENFTDGVFAIAITLLILNIDVPYLTGKTDAWRLWAALQNMWPAFYNYTLSFLILGSLWIIHTSQHHAVAKVDQPYLWLNILALMFVVLIPFSSSLLIDYEGVWIGEIWFHLNLLTVGLSFHLQWRYVSRRKTLQRPDVDEEYIKQGERRSLVLPIVSLIGIGVTFVVESWGTLVYLSIPIILSFLRRRGQNLNAES